MPHFFYIFTNICATFFLFMWLPLLNKIRRTIAIGYLLRKGAVFSDIRGVKFGVVKMNISSNSHIRIGCNFICNGADNSIDNNTFSRIDVSSGASLFIGNNSGMSTSCIHCTDEIHIGDNVNIGAGCLIMDTDFHSLNWKDRSDREIDLRNRKKAPVYIGNNVFIGAKCIICKGVTIGDHSVIGAGSVVRSDIPNDVIAGGNPCRIIRELKKK